MSKEQTPSGLRILERFFDRLEETSGQIEDLLFHHGDLLENVDIIGSQIPDPTEIGDGFIDSTFGEQPARSLLEKQASDEQKPSGDQLHREWNEPLLLACWQCLNHAVVDPEANQAAELPAKFIGTDKTTTNSRRRNLCNVDRDLEILMSTPTTIESYVEMYLPPSCNHQHQVRR